MAATVRGIQYPITISGGDLALATDADLIKAHIFSVLETEPGERVMNLGYGTPDFLFQGINDINVIAQIVRSRLTAEIPDAEFSCRGFIDDGGGAVLAVGWAIDGQPQPPLNFRLQG